jgi:excisionase family DNA binding protein
MTTLTAPLISVAEAAVRIGVSTRTVHRWIADGTLPARRFPTGTVRIAAGDLDALAPAPVNVTVTADGGGEGAWAVSIGGGELRGYSSESRAAAERMLWQVPATGGTVTVPDAGAIRVPHRAAGQAASITLAGMAASYDGGTVTFTVRADADPAGAA